MFEGAESQPFEPVETPDPPCRPGRSSSSQPRQRQGGNGLPEIGSSPEPISRRPSCRYEHLAVPRPEPASRGLVP